MNTKRLTQILNLPRSAEVFKITDYAAHLFIDFELGTDESESLKMVYYFSSQTLELWDENREHSIGTAFHRDRLPELLEILL